MGVEGVVRYGDFDVKRCENFGVKRCKELFGMNTVLTDRLIKLHVKKTGVVQCCPSPEFREMFPEIWGRVGCVSNFAKFGHGVRKVKTCE